MNVFRKPEKGSNVLIYARYLEIVEISVFRFQSDFFLGWRKRGTDVGMLCPELLSHATSTVRNIV